jgi:hypothetical protein
LRHYLSKGFSISREDYEKEISTTKGVKESFEAFERQEIQVGLRAPRHLRI